MDSNFHYSIRRLPNGDALLCFGSGTPVACNSQGRILVNKQGVPMTVEQARRARAQVQTGEERKPGLEEYHDLVAELIQPALNLRTMEIESKGIPISEEEFENLNVVMARDHGLKFSKGNLQSTIRAQSGGAKYDPIHRYLSGLGCSEKEVLSDREWARIAQLMLGLGDGWSQTVIQKWLISAIARVLEPGCKVDYALMLYGEQGIGKSSFFRALAGDYFTDSMGGLDQIKDDLMILHKAWIAEWSEADQVFVGANKAERIKRFVSAQDDTFRLPYGRTAQTLKRRSVIVGTTNRDDWANDPSGNRRFPVLKPTAIDTEWIKENRDRIWGRAVVEYRKGTQWWFSKEEEKQITEVASQYAAKNDLVEMALAELKRVKGEWRSTRDLLAEITERDAMTLSQRELNGFARLLSGLEAPGLLKEQRNYYSLKTKATTRIRTTCWCLTE